MSEDFDLQSLAEYLHIDPAQVARLAERKQIPARRVQGNWRFSQAEIHHWLENRIGLSEAEGLVEMESMLRPPLGGEETPSIPLAERMPLEAVDVPLAAHTAARSFRRWLRPCGADWIALGRAQDGRGGSGARRTSSHGAR